MAFEGELKDLSLGDIVQSILQNRLTGTLSLSLERHGEARVFFEEGKIALLAPPSQDGAPGPPFGEWLVRTGLVSRRALELARKKRGRKTLKTALEERGALDGEQYRASAERYLLDAAADLFLDARGRFRFQEGPAAKGSFDAELEQARAAVDPQGVALEGVRRQDEWQRLSAEIDETAQIYLPVERPEAAGDPSEESEGEARPPLSPEAARLLELLEGCRTLAECLPEMPCGRFGTVAALAELRDRGLVEAASADDLAARAREAEIAGEIAEAERLYRHALKMGRESMVVRENLALLLERAGRREDAGRERVQLGTARARAGDLALAIADMKRAADLLPEDTTPLKKMLEIARERRDEAQILAAGKRLAERYVAVKLPQRAVDLYRELLAEFPEDLDLRTRIAETLSAIGEQREAAAAWKEVGRLRERANQESGALEAYDRALASDADDEETKRRVELIRSGHLQKRRESARRGVRIALGALILSVAASAIAREVLAVRALRAWTLAAVHPVQGADGRALYEGFASVGRAFPGTLAAHEAKSLAETAIAGEIARVDLLIDAGAWREARIRLERLEAMDLRHDLEEAVPAARRRLETAVEVAMKRFGQERAAKQRTP